MKCCATACWVAMGMMMGAAAVMMMPTKRTASAKRQMKHTMQDVEGVMEDAMEGIRSILDM